jgi:glycosyltransferase involved in cell wall biosynthesis
MNDIKYYLLFNPDKKILNYTDIKKEYINDLKNNEIVVNIDTFFKKYASFDINIYIKINPELKQYSNIDILVHYHLYGSKINNTDYILSDSLPNPKPDQQLSFKIKLAHIFVHFFKIGGGECYVSNFNKYNNIFEETLFINKNYPNETLFKYNSKIIFYENYEELNTFLYDFDIILDHQLYWFDIDITKKSFLNIEPAKIIRIIHGVPIHYKNITDYNFYYSIELYTDIKSDQSWNNHLKIYNNIGVEKNKNIKNRYFDENNINVAIVGRINEDKIPTIFLNILLKFSSLYKKYKFNFYGEIDKIYYKYFIYEVSKNNNLIYNGIVDPEYISDVYLKNDILLHPSKSEAGATVILEAMSYGLPIIARNIGGIPNATSNYNYLCNTEKEMFEKLLLINNNNYESISNNNILKILNNNNQKILYKSLINDIQLIYNCEKNTIPNIIHYIFGLKKQIQEFSFVYYLSILSNFLINKPFIIYFHYQHLPYGYWWEKAKKYIKLNFINTENIYWNNKKIIKYAHKADKIRLELLLKYGGIYMDIDTITYKPYHHLLNYDFVIGIQEENYGDKNITLYCNAILFAKKNSIFIKKWIERYEEYFIPEGWCEASVHLPYFILNSLDENEKKNIKILEKEYFYYPSYNETSKIFENNELINEKLLTLHLWNTYSEKYYKNITNFDWIFTNNSLYSKLVDNILNLWSDNDSRLDNEIKKIYNISIVMIYDNNITSYEDILKSISYQEYIYYLNIEIIIIDNSSSKLYDIFDSNTDLKDIILKKNINIKIIELNTIVNNSIALEIGIKNRKNNIIISYTFDKILLKDEIIYQALRYNSNILDNKSGENYLNLIGEIYNY